MENYNIYNGMPFWCWNGDLQESEIIHQVHIFKDMGFGGFFIHSRTGLVTEYLGEKWFHLVRVAALEAYKIGLSAWLYDEDRWPSGTCGGEVTKVKKFQSKYISLYPCETSESFDKMTADENFIIAFAVKFNDKNEIKDYFAIDAFNDKPIGFSVKILMCEYMEKQDFYNGNTYLDTLNIDATMAFIQSTHAKYKKYCGDLFGKEIKGIFVDEPNRGTILYDFGLKNANSRNMLPYTYTLFEAFENKFCYSLKGKLIELFFYKENAAINKTMFDYLNFLQELFIENFAMPYHKWCKENNLLVTGHILHEDGLAIQTVFSGSVQRYYEFMDYPGIDVLTENHRPYWIVKQAQSVARQLNKGAVLSELYGGTGWQMTFQNYRDVGLWQAILGVNFRCQHLSWYTMEGQAKRDYPASIFYQSSWFDEYKYLEGYFSYLNKLLSGGKNVCKTAVLNPIESVWLYVARNWMKGGFCVNNDYIMRIELAYYKLFDILAFNQIDFDYCDEDILCRNYSISKENEVTFLHIGNQKYSKFYIVGADTIRNTTLQALSEFSENGGNVTIVGDSPKYIDAERNFDNKSFNFNNIEFNENAIVNDLCDNSLITISNKKILSNIRQYEDYYLLAILNTASDEKQNNVEVKLKNKFTIERLFYNKEDVFIASNSSGFKVNLDCGECAIYKLYYNKALVKNLENQEKKCQVKILNDKMEYVLKSENILPLDMARFSVNGSAWSDKTEILKIDDIVRAQIGLSERGGECLQPWFINKYGVNKNDKSINLKLLYDINIISLERDISLALEQSEKFDIFINGKLLEKKPGDKWVDVCFDKIALDKNLLKLGKNEMVLQTVYEESTNLESAFLLGFFGVDIINNENYINKLPKYIAFGNLNSQGFPFYSDKIIYKIGFFDKEIAVEVEEYSGSYVKVFDDNNSFLLAFPPYKTCCFKPSGEVKIELGLTRRNTFGPLHLAGVKSFAYEPNTFKTSGEQFIDSYSLINQGIMGNIKVSIFEE